MGCKEFGAPLIKISFFGPLCSAWKIINFDLLGGSNRWILTIWQPLHRLHYYVSWLLRADEYLTSRCFVVYEMGYWGVAIRCAPLVATIIKYCSYHDVTLQKKSSSFKYNNYNNFILFKVFYRVLPLMCNIKVTRSIVNFCTSQAVSLY